MKNKKYLSGVIILFLGFGYLFAEPYMAVRTGLKCVVCHINVTGGGKRTDFGVEYTHYKLRMASIRPSKKPVFFGGQINDVMSVGSNVRIDNITRIPYKPSPPQGYFDDLAERGFTFTQAQFDSVLKHYGDSAMATDTNQMFLTEANIYFQLDVLQDFLVFYVDQDLKGGGGPREIWGMMKFKFLNSYFKGGRMLLPYGYRIMDDLAFIRANAGYTYDRRGMGIEGGIEPGPFSIIANLTDNEFSYIAQIVFRHWRLGTSFARKTKGHGGFFFTKGNRGLGNLGGYKINFWGDDYLFGFFSGANFGRFTLTGEVDFITKEDPALKKPTDKVAIYVENNFHIIRGLNFKITGEVYDRNSDFFKNPYGIPISRDGQVRVTVGFDVFVLPFTQVGVYYRENSFVPDNANENQDQVILRAHGFF
jgi:hypothetical protein